MADNAQQAAARLQSNDGIDELSNNPRTAPHLPSLSQPRKCRFFGTKAGCRSGNNCPFLHETQAAISQPSRQTKPQAESAPQSQSTLESGSSVKGFDNATSKQSMHAAIQNAPRRVQKPIPQAQVEDPRTFQLNQVRRRFRPVETQNAGATVLDLKIVPSDPDFPYEIEALECLLTVPSTFPAEKPKIRITNNEMGRGYQLNVEAGFYAIIAQRPDDTLLQWLNALDKNLETLLSKDKAETVKIVVNQDKREHKPPDPVTPSKYEESTLPTPKHAANTVERVYTTAQLHSAQTTREVDTRQLEARLGRLPQFAKSSDGIVYTIPIEPRKRDDLPPSLHSIKTVKLIVPQLYNLQPCRIELQGIAGREAENLQRAFETRCKENPNLSLVAHINYFAQNMHNMTMACTNPESSSDAISMGGFPQSRSEQLIPDTTGQETESRSHVVVIPRPPEWNVKETTQSSDSDDSSLCHTDEEEEEEESEDAEDGQLEQQSESSQPHRGILLSFPHLEMHGIELLEVFSISLGIKCDRCRTQVEVQNIKNNAKIDAAAVRSESCRKCANAMSIGYRMDLIHENSVKAGYLDLDGATVVDLLPSNFIPTCSQCSTAIPQPGVTSVRGESTTVICRKCHGRMTFRIPEVKFLWISAAAIRASRAPPRKKQKERLGITVGEELPKRGRCKHYSKSFRWFRFSCCNKVFPCDRCHDEASDHPNEHANRMICGFCSREQNYRPEDCRFCHATLTGKKGSGFWEGGKGTRDKTKMSRKDPRKYKRNPGSKVVPSGSGSGNAGGQKK